MTTDNRQQAAGSRQQERRRSLNYTIYNRQSAIGFTLVELLVVIGVIILLAAVALPSMLGMLTAGADAQAANMISAQLTAARALAIRNNTYAGLHFQTAQDGQAGNYYMMIVEGVMDESDDRWTFAQPEGQMPRRLPGKIACGAVSGKFVNSDGSYKTAAFDEAGLKDFTSFTIVFAPNGSAVTCVGSGDKVKFAGNQVVRQVDGKGRLDPDSGSVATVFNDVAGSGTQLWDLSVANDGSAGEFPVTALVLFDYTAFYGSDTTVSADRAKYLNAEGQFIAVNVYTGQLLPRN